MSFCLGIIPARGGSKGVVDKNIRLLGGVPLIIRALQCAVNSVLLNDFIVTTDSLKIKNVVEDFGFTVPFVRPQELAEDQSKTIDAVLHALNWYENNYKHTVDYVVLLQPTSPLRLPSDIDDGIQILKKHENSSSLISCYVSNEHPNIMYSINSDGVLIPYDNIGKITRRQDLDKVYVRNGAIYVAKRDFLMKNMQMICNQPVPLIMERERSINIDEELDLVLAESIYNNYLNDN